MNRALLEKPFGPGQIRQRKGRNGLLDYVEGHTVIARLNEAFDGAWSFEVVSHEIREAEVLVLAKLAAEGVVKMQFGGRRGSSTSPSATTSTWRRVSTALAWISWRRSCRSRSNRASSASSGMADSVFASSDRVKSSGLSPPAPHVALNEHRDLSLGGLPRGDATHDLFQFSRVGVESMGV